MHEVNLMTWLKKEKPNYLRKNLRRPLVDIQFLDAVRQKQASNNL